MDLPRVIDELRAAVGVAHCITDPELTAPYCRDWTGRFSSFSPVVVRPATTAQVVAVVRTVGAAGLSVVPQGGNTGLVAGGVPRHGEIVLSLTRLDEVRDIDVDGGQLTAGAGATIAAVERAARSAGWSYGVDFGARDSATVGGTIATNAGGNRVMRYGSTREQVLGIEAVLADGSVITHLSGLVKDNTGYALAALLCGSEGTLGVVTAARLRLVPLLAHRVTALLGLPDVATAVRHVSLLRRRLPSLESAELCLAPGMRLVGARLGLPAPTTAPVVLLVECADQRDPTEDLAAAVASLEVHDAAVASEGERRAALWSWRERHTESIAALGSVNKLDVTLPTPAIASFVDRTTGLVGRLAPHAQTWIFGHLGDGNLHVNITGIDPDDDRVDAAVLGLVAELGGSISAEHGIGTLKAPWLQLSRSVAEIEAMRSLKRAWDPRGTLNPAVLFAGGAG